MLFIELTTGHNDKLLVNPMHIVLLRQLPKLYSREEGRTAVTVIGRDGETWVHQTYEDILALISGSGIE